MADIAGYVALGISITAVIVALPECINESIKFVKNVKGIRRQIKLDMKKLEDYKEKAKGKELTEKEIFDVKDIVDRNYRYSRRPILRVPKEKKQELKNLHDQFTKRHHRNVSIIRKSQKRYGNKNNLQKKYDTFHANQLKVNNYNKKYSKKNIVQNNNNNNNNNNNDSQYHLNNVKYSGKKSYQPKHIRKRSFSNPQPRNLNYNNRDRGNVKSNEFENLENNNKNKDEKKKISKKGSSFKKIFGISNCAPSDMKDNFIDEALL